MSRARFPDRGQGLVEFALILPVLLLILLGLFDFGRAVYAYNTISNAAREGARLAIVNQTFNGTAYQAEIEAANQATALGLDPNVDTQVLLTFFVPDTLVNCGITRDVGCIASMRVQYEFTAITPVIGVLIGPITLSTTTEIPIEATNP